MLLLQQTPVPLSSGTTDSAETKHALAMELLAVLGVSRRLEETKAQNIQTAVDSMSRAHPEYNPAFVAEWGKRMLATYHPAEYVAAMAPVYEKYLTAQELRELITVQTAHNGGKPGAVSPALTEKLQENAIKMQSEILGACGQVGAFAGGTIGQQIQKEHPEWFATQNK